jgi:hypothetical protein
MGKEQRAGIGAYPPWRLWSTVMSLSDIMILCDAVDGISLGQPVRYAAIGARNRGATNWFLPRC